jgi:hypothetical protein
VTPDPLDMTQYARGKHVLTWKLDTKGYHFATDVPAIEFTSPDWEKYFCDQQVHRDRRTVTVVDINTGGLAFAYNVNVVHEATGTRVVLDPVIQNDW